MAKSNRKPHRGYHTLKKAGGAIPLPPVRPPFSAPSPVASDPKAPCTAPVDGAPDLTSGFGMRVDPFLHVPAMHTGLDFRGNPGDEVRAVCDGRVTHAGWNGGYGKMIELDHGGGLSTRYGHLDGMNVEAGDVVKAGTVIGRLGSTGRSTGLHLHFETRLDGNAVDPTKEGDSRIVKAIQQAASPLAIINEEKVALGQENVPKSYSPPILNSN